MFVCMYVCMHVYGSLSDTIIARTGLVCVCNIMTLRKYVLTRMLVFV